MSEPVKELFAQAPPEVVRNYDNDSEYGRIGQYKYAGVFYEEFEQNLRGRRGIETYKEMSENDDVIGAILFAIEMLIRQTKFVVEPGGEEEKDQEVADFIKSCIDDMEMSWQDTVSEMLSFITFGWSWHEICYKRRMGKNKDPKLNSKHHDGLIGWQKLPVRSQDTLWRWEYDEYDTLVGMSQMAPPDFQIRTIPKEKSIHLVTKSRKNNPEGRSILRNAYRSYYFKKRMQEIEGIGVERDLAGLPVLTPPENVDIWDNSDPDMVRSLAYAEKLVTNVRRDAVEGIVLPHGWGFTLLNGGSKRQFEIGNIIERYDNRMAMTVLADFVLLGHQAVGSFALSSDKTELFSVAIGTFLEVICEAFNQQAIPKLIELNKSKFGNLENMPKLKHEDIEDMNLQDFAGFLEKVVGLGIVVPEENLAAYVRRVGRLPDPIENAPLPGEEAMAMQQKYSTKYKSPLAEESIDEKTSTDGENRSKQGKKDGGNQTTPQDDKGEIKKILGDIIEKKW